MRCYPIFAFASLAVAAPAAIFNATASDRGIPDKYIVKLKDLASRSSLDQTLGLLTAKADRVYSGTVFNGFAATLSSDELQSLRDHPDVDYIEQDAIITLDLDVNENDDSLIERQVSVPWNLIRISNIGSGTAYLWDGVSGASSCIYILDTGIAVTHPNFGGRAILAANFVGGDPNDENGHGTAIAGIAAATQVGVSRHSRVLSVKIYNNQGSGTISGVIQALDFVATDAPTRDCRDGKGFVNLTGGGAFSSAFNSAVARLVSQGHFLAMDPGTNAAPGACAVGMTNSANQVVPPNNPGSIIDIYAPGVQISSLSVAGGTTTFASLSGTAHVTGVAAYLADAENRSASQMCDYLWLIGTPLAFQSPNRLLYNGGGNP